MIADLVTAGLNVNRGQKICLRLRFPSDRSLFLPIEQVTDTMLHELSHNVHGPHDAKFHALWDQLREEHEALMMKGYTGEGFLSEGQRLGGRGVSMQEARQLARLAAERRRNLTAGSGQRLGGMAPRPGQDMRRVIADAADRRNKTLRGCASNTYNEEEIRAIAETASKNGFRTQAEEDAANEAAIAQALWELVQEDKKAKHGTSYTPPSAQNPAGSGGRAAASPSLPSSSSSSSSSHGSSSRTEAGKEPGAYRPQRAVGDPALTSWSCQVCTLENPLNYLCCDACGTERPQQPTRTPANRAAKRQRTETIDLTDGSPERPRSGRATGMSSPAAATPASKPKMWTCSFCGRVRDWNLWSCDLCGKIKETS